MTARVVIAGGGPRAIMLLERILARTDAGTRLEIDVVDPYPVGAGRIWRRAQSPLLKLNSMARDVTVFTDETCTIEGPVVPGPSLIEWVEQWRAGLLPDVEIDDEVVAAETARLAGDDFPTRRLQSSYLDWFARRVIASAPVGVVIRTHLDTVDAVRSRGTGWAVDLASGRSLPADAVVYALGHIGSDPPSTPPADAVVYALGHIGSDPPSTPPAPDAPVPSPPLAEVARRAGLVHIPPAFTADLDLDGIAPGVDVLVRGMGLASVDLVVLLTQGRGGRFERSGGALRYLPSGREPRLHLGSRRGVPYRSKVSSRLHGDAPRRDVLTPAVVARLAASDGRAPLRDFERDVWPLIASELLHGHYRELFTGHPARVSGTWEQARALLGTHAWDDPALHAALAAVVPDPLDRLEIAALDRPLAGARFGDGGGDGEGEGDGGGVHDAVVAHIRRDLHLRTSEERSPAHGLFLAALLSFLAVSEIPAERWNARSRSVSLPTRWHTFFSYIASGPPAHRLEELLALAEAGIVRFLGPDLAVGIEADAGGAASFVASSPSAPGATRARIVVEARLPDSDAEASPSRLLRQLATVHGTVLRVADGERVSTIGRVVVDGDGRVVRGNGSVHEDLFALGPFTSHPEGGAFTRPRSDALSFRQTDRIAAAVHARLIAAGSVRAAIPTART